MESTDHCYKEFLILQPDKVRFSDLIHLLYSGDVCANKAVDCPDGTDTINSLERRWALVASLLVQMILYKLATPMAAFGSRLEKWMNLFYDNGSSFKALFATLLNGKNSSPDKDSANYRSAIGLLDKRIDLDKNIKPGDSRYNSALSIMAAKLAYENKNAITSVVTNNWKMNFVEYCDCYNEFEERNTTQAFILCDKPTDVNLVVVAFSGTKPFNALQWSTDVDFSWYKIPGVGKIHGGFMKALGLQKKIGWPKNLSEDKEGHIYAYYAIREKLREILEENPKAKFLVTGHSLGGALAVLFPCILKYHDEEKLLEKLEGVYTYGQPRVGDATFGDYAKEFLYSPKKRYFRFVYGNDIVPRVPYDGKALLFKHFGDCFYYDIFYRGKVMSEEPNKNYFSIFTMIPKYFTAIMEIIRSFFIGYINGSDYSEGWASIFGRMFGLIIPGIPPHGPVDYVNSTRLGHFSIFPSTNK
ncbi:hypothetical protein LUZ60_001280 [Juncus effusus]|nr:hypothetical protein LUZ60_001280 [Juncus effusus]